jgi:hypothetical protein
MFVAADTSLVQILAGSLLGLFGGVGATAVWEGIVRPFRDRRNIARSLSAEVRLNRDRVELAVQTRRQSTRDVPLNVRLSTVVFESLAEKFAELPDEILPDIMALYHRFTSLNALVTRMADDLQNFQGAEAGSKTEEIYATRLEEAFPWLDEGLAITLQSIATLLPQLVRYAGFTSQQWLEIGAGPDPAIKIAATKT